jgi:hypothetical protein
LSGLSGSGSPEDNLIAFSAAGPRQINLVDPDLVASLQSVQLRLTNGSASLIGLTGLTVSNITGSTYAATQWTVSGNTDLLQSYLANLAIKPNANFFGTIGLDLTVSDLSLKNPGVAAMLHLDLTVSSVNDLPTLTVQARDLIEGDSVVITASQLSSTDVEDPPGQMTFELTSTPAMGHLLLSGQIMSAGSRFTQAQLDSGLVSYKHQAAGAGVERLSLVAIDLNGGRSGDQTLELKVSRAAVVQTTTTPSTVAPSSAPALTESVILNQGIGPTVSVLNPSTASNVTGGEVAAATSKPVGSKAPAANQAAESSANVQAGAPSTHSEMASGGSISTSTNINQMGSNQAADRSQVSPFAQLRQNQDSPNNRTAVAMPEGQRLQLEKARSSMAAKSFQSDLKQMREEVNQGIRLERTIVTSTVAVSTGVSIGYVIWLLRGGVLLSSLLASVPAWRTFDPLPILASTNKSDKDAEDDSLENLLKKARKKLSLNRKLTDEATS